MVHDATKAPNSDAIIPRRLDHEYLVWLGAKFDHHGGVVPLRARVASDHFRCRRARLEEQKVIGVSNLKELLLRNLLLPPELAGHRS